MRLGVYMGSFNPPHKAHIGIVNYLLNNDYVDKVLFVPTLEYWNKKILVSITDRINMLKIYENKNIKVDNKHNDCIYTYDLMKKLEKEYPGYKLSIIMGADNFITLNKWKNYQELLKYNIIIVNRNGINIKKYFDNMKGNFTILDNYQETNISSSEIRDNLSNEYLDDEVLEYIRKHHLYQ